MKTRLLFALAVVGIVRSAHTGAPSEIAEKTPSNLWQFARANAETHRFSTLFTAQDVRNHLSREEGLNTAIDWCKKLR